MALPSRSKWGTRARQVRAGVLILGVLGPLLVARGVSAASNYSIELASLSSEGVQGVGLNMKGVSVSGDGQFIAFVSDAANLAPNDLNAQYDVFLRDTVARTTQRVSSYPGGSASSGDKAALSADGRFVAFVTTAGLTSTDTNGTHDAYVFDRTTQATQRVSVSSSGDQGTKASSNPRLSGDGRYVVFESTSPELAPGDGGSTSDVFIRDLTLGTTTRLSNGSGMSPQISRDGRFVYYSTLNSSYQPANPGSPLPLDGSLYDRQTGASQPQPDGGWLSGDGTHLAYARGSVDWDWGWRGSVLVRDLTGATSDDLVTNQEGNGEIPRFALSFDGRFVLLGSSAALTPDAGPYYRKNVYLFDRTLRHWMKASTPQDGGASDGDSDSGSVSEDGRTVAFASSASNLTIDTNGRWDVFKSIMTPPSSPTLSNPVADSSHNSDHVRFTGSADPGSRIVILENNTVLGSVNADSSGAWTTLIAIPDGNHTLNVRRENQAFVRSDPVTLSISVAALRYPFSAPYDKPTHNSTVCNDKASPSTPSSASNHADGATGAIGVTATANVFAAPTGAVIPIACQGVGGASASSDAGFQVRVPLTETGTFRLDVTMTVSGSTSVRFPLAPYGYFVGNGGSAFLSAQATLGIETCSTSCYISSNGYKLTNLSFSPGGPSGYSGQVRISVEVVVGDLSGSALVGNAGLIAQTVVSGWGQASVQANGALNSMTIVKATM